MSAICGIFNTDGSPLANNVLQGMTASLSHRGPDGNGTWQDGPAGLGQQLFCITPESLGEKLPYCEPASGLAITADARLDNREELCAKLNIPLDQQPGIPDSMLILKSYEKWGKECPKQLLGEFVFVIWDEKRREMVCVTDHMCNKPLYYHFRPSRCFAFATEIRAIHTIPGIDRRPNLRKLATLSLFGVERESTYFEGIFLMPGATVMTITANGIHKTEYWEPDYDNRLNLKTEAEYVEAFRDVFFQAVAARLRSAFPVASLFSGGLDSSAITGTAARLLAGEGRSLTAFSAVLPDSYGGNVRDEREYIDLLQGRPALSIEYISDAWRGPFDDLERLIWSGEKPVYTSRHYLYTAFAAAAASKGVRVILDGVGGEMGPTFHGYGYYAELFRKGQWPSLLREVVARGRVEQRGCLGLIKSEVLWPLLPGWWLRRYKPRFDLVMVGQGTVLRPDFVRQQLDHKTMREYQLLSYTLGEVLPDHRKNQVKSINFVRQARTGLAFSGYEKVALSMPFLDKRVIEFCLALPGTMKVNNGYKRYMIRAGMAGILPDAIRFRTTKEPFSVDYHDRYNWQRGKVQALLQAMVKTPLAQEIVDTDRLESMLKYSMQTNRCSTPDEFSAMHMVPQGVFLLAFLNTFK
ncbi:asparagine synthase-related protein [Sporomusa sp. KB1]|jgi:asparagine synthase (glutamine-hydrolysing)|uniref:asparagine synthase-related protein n=1 Tax=Sporomusa sp. KB1 TaxID=943346 RepID=UPI0011AA1D91|nr:asparagine synthase-related protein [Sporomusa sp. KB1]TWH45937.1 asparagine synthase (glutamine-hydrolysing) [Sporomusa sp. KB1]